MITGVGSDLFSVTIPQFLWKLITESGRVVFICLHYNGPDKRKFAADSGAKKNDFVNWGLGDLSYSEGVVDVNVFAEPLCAIRK